MNTCGIKARCENESRHFSARHGKGEGEKKHRKREKRSKGRTRENKWRKKEC